MASRLPFPTSLQGRLRGVLPSFSPRDRALILFGLNTGFRACEHARITVGHVWDGENIRDEITLARQALKGGRGAYRAGLRSRTVPLNAEARTALAEYLAWRAQNGEGLERGAFLFPNPRSGRGLSRWQITRVVKKLAGLTGVSAPERYGSHSLRKSFCDSVYVASGHDINLTRAIMGHRNIATTQRYLEVQTDDIRRTLLSLGPLPAAVTFN